MDNGFLKDRLDERRRQGLLRELTVRDTGLVDFSSNDYLGFAQLAALWQPEELHKYGSTGSRLLTGNAHITEHTETFIADFHRAEAGLIFNSGYDANTGLFSCVAGKNDTIIYDAGSHASIKEGARLSLAKRFSFRHNDLNDLEKKIKQSQGRIFVAVESVYSMDGDTAPLKELTKLADKYPRLYLIVDEAHGTGVFGAHGEGLAQQLGIQNRFFARVHTFGKAIGCQGAIVLGSRYLREYLVNFSRPFIYTTALPLPVVLAIRRAYELLQSDNGPLMALRRNVDYFVQKAAKQNSPGIIATDSAVHIIPVPGNENVRKASLQMLDAGLDIRPVMSPTVPAGLERLRICLHAFNTFQQMDDLFAAWQAAQATL